MKEDKTSSDKKEIANQTIVSKNTWENYKEKTAENLRLKTVVELRAILKKENYPGKLDKLRKEERSRILKLIEGMEKGDEVKVKGYKITREAQKDTEVFLPEHTGYNQALSDLKNLINKR